jgi:hypothetical protein
MLSTSRGAKLKNFSVEKNSIDFCKLVFSTIHACRGHLYSARLAQISTPNWAAACQKKQPTLQWSAKLWGNIGKAIFGEDSDKAPGLPAEQLRKAKEKTRKALQRARTKEKESAERKAQAGVKRERDAEAVAAAADDFA